MHDLFKFFGGDRHSEVPLLSDAGGVLTYRDFYQRAIQLSAWLQGQGLKAGDRVLLHTDKPGLFFPSMFACWDQGCCAVPLNPKHPEETRKHILDKVRASLTIDDSVLEAIGQEGGEDADNRSSVFGDLDPAIILFTSGTTGVPKGVCQSLKAVAENASLTSEVMELNVNDTIMVNTPCYFTSAICHFLTLMQVGGGTVFETGFRFGKSLLDMIEERRVTGFGGAPTHLTRVIGALKEAHHTSHLRFWVSSGESLPLEAIERTREVLPDVSLFYMYGLTEVSGRLCVLTPNKFPSHKGSVGRPLGQMSVKVIGDDGQIVGCREKGEIYVSGSMLTSGYFEEDAINAASFNQHGFRTGDMGWMDEEGFVWIEGRADDMIKRGGEKVFVKQIENLLKSISGVTDAVVIVVDDPVLGKSPVAFLTQGDPSREILMQELKKHLAPSSLPAKILYVEEIPRTGPGKADRNALKKIYKEALA